MKTLNILKIDEEGIVEDVLSTNPRLKDLGIVKGTRVRCLLKSPLGEPKAYLIRGAVFALRREDAEGILIKEPYKEAVYE